MWREIYNIAMNICLASGAFIALGFLILALYLIHAEYYSGVNKNPDGK